MDIVFALDSDPDSSRTFCLNFPSVHFRLSDIRDVPVDSVLSLVNQHKPHPILFCGCAPCQPFTKHNTVHPARENDHRLPLLAYFANFIQHCAPDIVFLENVPGLQTFAHPTQPFDHFCKTLDANGYHIVTQSVRLMRYGIPQSRRRLILLASRHRPIHLPPETNGPGTPNLRYETVRDWIADLPPILASQEHPTVPNHRAAALSLRNLERLRATPEGGGHRDWPPHLKLPCHATTSGYSDVYGRLSWDRPASGLTTRCISYSNGRFGHPVQDRAISIREAACLQTFPLTFTFTGSLSSMARQIGNAVPVRLTEIFGYHVRDHLTRSNAPL